MALIHILTDGTETGLTAANKINADMTKTDNIQTASGLEQTGLYIADLTTNYLTTSIGLKDSDKKLDTELKAVDTAYKLADTTLTTNLGNEVTARTNADIAIQSEIDAIETAAGLSIIGTYIADNTTNYITTATDLMNADKLIDTQVKLNADNISTNTTNISTNTVNLGLLTNRVTTLENFKDPSVAIQGGIQPTQTLVGGTPEKINWMDNAVINYGTDIAGDIANDQFTINSNGIYKIEGVVTLTAPNNDEVKIELYKNNLPTGAYFVDTGKGATTLHASYLFATPLVTSDILSLYVVSTGTTVDIKAVFMSVTKTKY